MRWAYGITTVPERLNDLFPRTLLSLSKAGFDKPRLFVDGAKDASAYERFGLEVTCRYPRIRLFGSWCLALGELYLRDSQSERYAIFQDDFVTGYNLREYLERTEYPQKGYLNLYTFPSNQRVADRNRQSGWFRSNQLGKGAVALVFDNLTVRTLLSSFHMIERVQDVHKGHRSIDGGVAQSMTKAGWTEYCHNPSLVQHTGELSSHGNKKQPLAPSFRGEEFNFLDLLPCIQNAS